MTQEEKAKAYDKVLEWATEAHKVCDGMLKEDLEHLFPELKESEDEEIRKDIINFIRTTPKAKQKHHSWIAWLEKQGGHAKFINGIQVGDKVTRNEDGVLVNLSQLNRVAKKQGEHKPAWSDEDEKNSLEIKCLIGSYRTGADEYRLYSWIDSFKGRVQPQSKQGWSEEAQQIIKDAACFILSCVNTADTKEEEERLEELADKLQDLRPQKKEALPQWRRLPLNGVSFAPDYWCVMDVITSTVGANSASVSALVKGDYYVPLFELEKFIRNI